MSSNAPPSKKRKISKYIGTIEDYQRSVKPVYGDDSGIQYSHERLIFNDNSPLHPRTIKPVVKDDCNIQYSYKNVSEEKKED